MASRCQTALSYAWNEIVATMLIVLAVAGCASVGTFSRTGSMTVARYGHTATLLPDGRVLIAGGGDADIYDPQAGTFSRTGSMTVARYGHTATLLPDGRVLIAGGGDADIYDPQAGTFSQTGSMKSARIGHTATLLNDGRVLLVGGQGDDPFRIPLTSAELYDSKTGDFSLTGPMDVAAGPLAAALLSDGRVLIVGGMRTDANGVLMSPASAELYDPKTGTFSPTGSPAGSYMEETATLLADGNVLIAGFDPAKGHSSAELYDPSSGTFRPTGSPSRVGGGPATLLQDGRILIASSGSAEVYDPRSGTFSAAGSMTESRQYFTATLLKDGRVLIAGGYFDQNANGAKTSLASAELYKP